MSALYRLLSTALVLGIGAEFFLAGAGAFGATSFHSHRLLGMALLVAGILTFVFAALARRNARIASGVALLLALQVILGHLGKNHPWIGAVHGLTAALVAAAASINARRAMTT
jgi:hypothetical protein